MRRKFSAISVLIVVVSLIILASVSADSSTNRRGELTSAEASAALSGVGGIEGKLPESGNVKVIVQLADAPLASYQGGVQGLAATSPRATGTNRLDANSPASVAYLNYLAAQQANFVQAAQAVSPDAKAIANYRAAFNGVALDLPVADARRLLSVPGVVRVIVNQIEKPVTDSSPEFLGAPTLWGQVGGQSSAGEDIVIGTIDSGIYNPSDAVTDTAGIPPDIHPSLADPDPSGKDYPSTFDNVGVCDETDPQEQDGSFGECNDKLLGAWWYNAAGIADAGEFRSPQDGDGHGTHTATTSGGNAGVVTPLGTISGIAPRARVIAYKVCWEEDPEIPDDGGCGTVDSTSAVDQAVLDGVDVINFSISGGQSPWTDPVELAFLGAVEAGIVVNASGGNDAVPEAVNHLAPWDITVAASTQERAFVGTLVLSDTEAPGPFQGASLFPGEVTGNLVLAPSQGGTDPTPSLCQQPYAPGTFEATDIVICRRGVNPRVEKYQNVAAGGAGAGIIVNATDNQGVVADPCPQEPAGFVCLHLERNATSTSDSGEALIAYVAANPDAIGTIAGGVRTTGQGDVMAGFSSQGPSIIPDILKPDITSVGVSVLAGGTTTPYDVGDPALLFDVISGTSMSSPHAAGTAALMRQLHPDWTPMEIKSAMMTTAITEGVTKPDATTPADPFNYGSGRTDLNAMGFAGLVLDEDATSMEAANPEDGGDPKTLNLANFTNSNCVGTCTWVRTLRNTRDTDWTWSASTSGLPITVEPASFTIPMSGTQVITVTADVAGLENGAYVFGEVRLIDGGAADNNPAGVDTTPDAHFPVVVRPNSGNLPDRLLIETYRDAGSETISDLEAIEITDLTVREYGLIEGTYYSATLPGDSDNSSPYDDLTDGVLTVTVPVPADSLRFVVEVTESESQDIDLFVTQDTNGDGLPAEDEEVCVSATGAVLEYCNIDNPDAGDYIIVAQNWTPSSDTAEDLLRLAVGIVPPTDAGNMTVTGPESVPQQQPFDLQVAYNVDSEVGDRWYGAFDVGSSPDEPVLAAPGDIGVVNVDLRRLGNDVTKEVSPEQITAPGAYTLTYTITVAPNMSSEDVTYSLTDTIPAGLSYVDGSATGGATVEGNVLTWTGTQPAAGLGYIMTTSENDATCAEDYGYFDLASLGILPQAPLVGDEAMFAAFTTGSPINYFGVDYQGIAFSTNGYVTFANPINGVVQSPNNTDLPNPTAPNNVGAILWDDLEVVYSQPLTRGISLASTGSTAEDFFIIEYDDVEQAGDPAARYDFQIFMSRQVNNAPGAYEFNFAYDNITGPVDSATVGVENADGTSGVQYEGPITDGLSICFDYGALANEPQVITYQVTTGDLTAPEDCGTEFTNNVQHSVDQPGSEVETASSTVTVACDPTSVTLDDFNGSGSANLPWLAAALASMLVLVGGLVVLRRNR